MHALRLGVPIDEFFTKYLKRPETSRSKLRTIHDGVRILLSIFLLVKHHRPLLVFGLIGLLAVLVSMAFGLPTVKEFVETGFVSRLPSAILAASLMVIAVVSFATGIILASVARVAWEQRRLLYLIVPRYKGPQVVDERPRQC